MALEYQSASESYSYEEDDLMKALKENDRLKNANKELETKESSVIKEINMLRMHLEATNIRKKVLAKQLQEKERHCEKIE